MSQEPNPAVVVNSAPQDDWTSPAYWNSERIGVACFVGVDVLLILLVILAVLGIFDTHHADAPLSPVSLPPLSPPINTVVTFPYL